MPHREQTMNKTLQDASDEAPRISTVTASAPALDLSVLEQITGGSAEMLRDLLSTFTRTSKQLVEDMERALSRGDAKLFLRAAHTLKGASGILGARALQRACEAVEDAASEQGLEAARDLFPKLEQCHAATAALVDATIRRAA